MSCYTDFLFIRLIFILLDCFWKIKYTDKVIDNFDFSVFVCFRYAASLFAGRFRNVNLVDKLP